MQINEYGRILVTGGSGFVGRALVKFLIAHGCRPLVADVDVSETESEGAFQIARIDLTDHTAVSDLLEDYGPDLVMHLAGTLGRDDPTGEACEGLNFAATAFILDKLSAAGPGKAVLMGSASEYGDSPTPLREDMEPRPISHYARSKAMATRYATELFNRTGFDVTVLRAFSVYGPDQPANMFLSQLVRHALLNLDFNMSDGTQKRDLLFLDDMVSALVAASVSQKTAGRVINVGTGRAIALRDAALYVWNACGADPERLHFGAVAKAGDDPFDTLADIALAGELMNWRPRSSFEAGIRSMIESTRASLVNEGRTQADPS